MTRDMLKRVVDISKQRAHVSVRRKQLVIHRYEDDEDVQVPLEDLGVLLLDNRATTVTQPALASVARSGGVAIVCDERHMPVATLLPYSSHLEQTQRLRLQIDASKPLKKRTWQQLVQAKVRAQAWSIEPHAAPAARRLRKLAATVRSGDPSNVEGQAARLYWEHYLVSRRFRRIAQGDGGNALLDYGYAVLRSVVARALVASGLQPALGVHHSNRSNGFCLADDFMEPLRPLVDVAARPLLEAGETELTPNAKQALLSMLAADVRIEETTGPLVAQLRRVTASYARRLEDPTALLLIPEPIGPATWN